MKLIFIFSILSFNFAKGQISNIDINVYFELQKVNNYELYVITDNDCIVAAQKENYLDQLIEKKELNSKIKLLLIYQKKSYYIPIYPKNVEVKIDFLIDNRWFLNKTKKKLKVSRLRYLFKQRCYAILDRSHSIMIGARTDKNYAICE